ncbi:MAG: Fpg/Nei family DNA glycosylase [Myxococcales bacterium]|nr:Fpg/Nei family DNA glycosylase [Myxococcales bacterium]
MPEGDTIHRTASRLREVMASKEILVAESTRPEVQLDSVVGARVRDVEARGKNLLLHFDNGCVLYSHMRMTGSWHVYRRGEKWQRPYQQLDVRLDNDAWSALCFNAPVVELLSDFSFRQHPVLRRLGPDLLAESPDFDEILRRARQRNDRTLGELVMAQDVACGIGNVYKSETLFLEGLSPFSPVSSIDDGRLVAFFRRARSLMKRNLRGEPRTTRTSGGGRLWVYGRANEACHRCGSKILMKRQGEAARSSYWCPSCQPGTR